MFHTFLIASGYPTTFSPNLYYNSFFPSLCYNNSNILMYPTTTSIQLKQNHVESPVVPKLKKYSKKIQKKSRNKKKQRDNEFKVKAQNAKRNIVSNIVHHLISFNQRKKISLPIILKIIQLHKLSLIPDDFYAFLKKINLKNYVKVQTLKAICKGPPESSNKYNFDLAKLFRIMAHYFLHSECFISIQLSKKIRSELKDEHFKKRRQMMKMMAQQ